MSAGSSELCSWPVSHRGNDASFPVPDELHWHGAAPDRFMTHLSITEGVGDADKPETHWGEHVTDEEYGAR